MSKLFEELMRGLEEVNAYLAGERKGFKVTLPAEIDARVKAAKAKRVAGSAEEQIEQAVQRAND